jgi:hypothetical protein
MMHAICSASGSLRQNSRVTIRICRLGSFGHNDILFWLSELFWLDEAWVRLANIACIGLRRLGFVPPSGAAVAGTARVRSAKMSNAWPERLGFVRRDLAAAAGTPLARLAKIFQIALLRVPKKAGDPPKLFIHFGVRVRIRVWQTRQTGLIAMAASSAAAAAQSHIV